MMRRTVLPALGGRAALALLCIAPAAAQEYPVKPVRFVIAFSPGGPSDILTRVIGSKLSEALSQFLRQCGGPEFLGPAASGSTHRVQELDNSLLEALLRCGLLLTHPLSLNFSNHTLQRSSDTFLQQRRLDTEGFCRSNSLPTPVDWCHFRRHLGNWRP